MEDKDGEAEAPLRAASPGPGPVDADRVAALRDALQAGTLRIDAQLIAVRLLGWERLLARG